jgi:hypothetical protein
LDSGEKVDGIVTGYRSGDKVFFVLTVDKPPNDGARILNIPQAQFKTGAAEVATPSYVKEPVRHVAFGRAAERFRDQFPSTFFCPDGGFCAAGGARASFNSAQGFEWK